jgi:hypothetical protein
MYTYLWGLWYHRVPELLGPHTDLTVQFFYAVTAQEAERIKARFFFEHAEYRPETLELYSSGYMVGNRKLQGTIKTEAVPQEATPE